MRYLIALISFLFITFAFANDREAEEPFPLSTPEQVVALHSEPSYLIGGLISPLSGQPVLRTTDLVVRGAQNILLKRSYVPPYIPHSFAEHKYTKEEWQHYHLYQHLNKTYKGWQFYPHLRLEFTSRSKQVALTDPQGMTLSFRLSGPNNSATLLSPPYGLSNAAGDTPGGHYDPRNTWISYDERANQITVYAPGGITRFYHKKGRATPTSLLYLLQKEILPSGKVLRYHYTDTNQLTSIESLDPQERFVYASLKIQGSPWAGKCHFTSSCGKTVDYTYHKRPLKVKLKEKTKGRKIGLEGNYLFPPILSSVSTPFYRNESLHYSEKFLLDAYSGQEAMFTLTHTSDPHYRVGELLFPVGPDDTPHPVYTLSYQPPLVGEKEGSTTVKHSDGTSITYHFSKNLLTTLIQYFGQEGDLKKEKALSWNDNQWLEAIEIRDGQNHLLYRKAYEYDRFGNPILERLTGDLTGEGTQETITTKRKFSENGRHLLLREETEEGKVVTFSYLPHTNLVTAKLTKEGDKILLREFHFYDDCHNLIQKISDNGDTECKNNLSNVTQRTLTTYTLRQAPPFLHMPEWIEDTYWEAGTTKPLKKRHLIYDQEGNVAQEEVYGADGNHAYTLYKTYNERGDILTETNPLGQQAVYTYDPRGRLETSTTFSQKILKTFQHDTKGRLRTLTEKGEDGVLHVVSSDYDFHDRRTHKKDPFSNSTHYTYDPLVNQITQTIFPPIGSLEEEPIPVSTFSSYDPLGRQLTKTDPNGHTTTYRYNAYGSPVEINYPDGGTQRFLYDKTGRLIRHTDPDGLTLYYQNDLFGRVVLKTHLSVDGALLAEERFTYNSFNLLTSTDKEGHLTRYTYDGAGRKVQENISGHITDFSYNPLGHLAILHKHNGDNTLLVDYTRDLEGRLLQEHKTNTSGHTLYKIRYSYDVDGNQETITRYINGKEAIETFTYDSFSRPRRHIDAEGHITTTTYNENQINPLGQRVLQTTTIDPRHIATLETQDALNRTIRIATVSPQGNILSCREMTHDPQGNLLYREDHVYENTHLHNTQTVKYTYTPSHQIETLTRGLGTQDPRITTYTYLPSGKRSSKTLPDGTTLAYSYHPLGPISRLDSSDGLIHHAFEYDLNGHLIYAFDENQNIAIQRTLDPFGNVTQEEFPSGLKVTKEYDHFNRLTSLNMGSQGTVLYTYDPLFLRKVTRVSPLGEPLYSHTYDEYDQDGNLVAERLIGALGHATHATSPRGEKTHIASPYFSQECTYDPSGNLLTNIVDGGEHHYTYDPLSQLSSENSPIQSITYAHDSLYNRIQKNADTYLINDLNELLSSDNIHCLYDRNGNQILKKTPSETLHFTYDPLGQLIEGISDGKKIHFAYDPLGRRWGKVIYTLNGNEWNETNREYYLYDDQNEIGAFPKPNEAKNLRILGLAAQKGNPATIGVEIEGQVFAPLLDIQGNIRRLVSLNTRSVEESLDFTAFGEPLQNSSKETLNPWSFASKRLDPELGLIYFGKRYYDPLIGRWLSVDPAGFVDSVNLYQYVLNNPFYYFDPDGQEAAAIALTLWGASQAGGLSLAALAGPVGWVIGGTAILTSIIAWKGPEIARTVNNWMEYKAESLPSMPFYESYHKLATEKKQIDSRLPSDPDELLNDPNWQETSHPGAKENGHRTFENKKTGEALRYDEAKPDAPGHKGESHWHRHNPKSINRFDEYLDADDVPVSRNSPESHLYSPEQTI